MNQSIDKSDIEDPSVLIEEFEWIPLYDTTLVRTLDVICPNYTELINDQPSTASAATVTNYIVHKTQVMLEVKTTFPQQKLFGLKEVTKPLNEFQSLALNLQFEMKQFARLSLLELGDVRDMTEEDYFSLVKVSLMEFYSRIWESQSEVSKENCKQFLKQKPQPLNVSENDINSGKSTPTSKPASRPLSATIFANKLIHKLSVSVGRSSSSANHTPSQSQCSTPKSQSPPSLSRNTSIKKLNASRFLKNAVSLSAGNTPVSNLAVQISFESSGYNLPSFTLKVTVDITLERLIKAVRNKCILDGHPIPDPYFQFVLIDQPETKINSENLYEYLTSLGDHQLNIIPDDSQPEPQDTGLLTPRTIPKLARSNTQVGAKRPQPRQRKHKMSRVLNGLDLGVLVNEPPVIPPRRAPTAPHSANRSKSNFSSPKLSLSIPPHDGSSMTIPQLCDGRSSLEDSSSEKDSPVTPTSSPPTNPIVMNFKQKHDSEFKHSKSVKRASKFLRSFTMKFDKSQSQSEPTTPFLSRSQTQVPKSLVQKETLVFKSLLEGGQLELPGSGNDSLGLTSNGVQHLNISVTINHDLKYHFELDPYQPTYTSVMNRVIYHFNQVGVPLRLLNEMCLVYLSEGGNIEITNTTELQKLINDCKGQNDLELLLVPKSLMEDNKRRGIQWELPPNLHDVGTGIEGNHSVVVL